ncbi:MAG: hypothetical protein HKN16_13245 [Saprospiraceae bacterium]|nr:hypothetical protein [Saprospiraceae bacterium]
MSKEPLLGLAISYGYQLPGGDLKEDFGDSFQAGFNLDFVSKQNLILGLQSNFFFGNQVKKDALASLRGPDGLIASPDGFLAEINGKERGQYYGAHVGKLFPISKSQRAGVRVTLGGGYLLHKIRLQEDFQVTIPQIQGEYKKGYDNLHAGFTLTGFLGYQYLAKDGLINFLGGVELNQAFTSPQRTWNFGENAPNEGNRNDQLVTFKLAWIIPFYFETNPDQIFY